VLSAVNLEGIGVDAHYTRVVLMITHIQVVQLGVDCKSWTAILKSTRTLLLFQQKTSGADDWLCHQKVVKSGQRPSILLNEKIKALIEHYQQIGIQTTNMTPNSSVMAS
jgi:hypothetical protein